MRKARLVTILLSLLLLSSCANSVLGHDKEDFMEMVSSGDYEFLNSVDYLKNGIDEINRLEEGSSYYMSFVYKRLDKKLFSNKLLYQELQNKNSYYKEKALLQLVSDLIEQKEYFKAELYADEYLKENGANSQVSKLLVEAMYWQRKDKELLPILNNFDRADFSDYQNYELDLIRAVALARTNNDRWVSEFRAIFFEQPLTPVMQRAYSFISYYQEYSTPFTQGEKDYFNALAMASSGNYRGAYQIIIPLLNRENWIFRTKQSVVNISRIIKSTNNFYNIRDSYTPFSNAIANSNYDTRLDAMVSFASLYFSQERYTAVVSILRDEIEKMDAGKTRDDAIYLYLISLSYADRSQILRSMDINLDLIDDRGYVGVIFDHVITALVQGREWKVISDLRRVAKKFDIRSVNSRLNWIVSRSYFHYYLPTENREKDIQNLLEEIVSRDNFTYYSFISNAYLGKKSNLVLPAIEEAKEFSEDDIWIAGFLKFGLLDEARSNSLVVEDLNYIICVDIAKRLDNSNQHLEALRFMGKHDVDLNSETYPIYYPLPYKEKIIEVSRQYGFPEVLFSGLLRTESGFDPFVVSSAGAVGLAQLLPSTAREQAQNMGLSSFDINDPHTNILLGGKYMEWLLSKYNSYPVSAMAYNAGPGNVWKWQGMWGDLPDELFIEAAPFKETRDYVPKIFRAAVYYGYNEFGMEPEEVLESIFEGIK